MSAEILSYLQNGRTVSIVATHDRELVDILRIVTSFIISANPLIVKMD